MDDALVVKASPGLVLGEILPAVAVGVAERGDEVAEAAVGDGDWGIQALDLVSRRQPRALGQGRSRPGSRDRHQQTAHQDAHTTKSGQMQGDCLPVMDPVAVHPYTASDAM